MHLCGLKKTRENVDSSDHISNDTKSKNSTIEWSQIVGMRNVFVYENFGVDSKLV